MEANPRRTKQHDPHSPNLGFTSKSWGKERTDTAFERYDQLRKLRIKQKWGSGTLADIMCHLNPKPRPIKAKFGNDTTLNTTRNVFQCKQCKKWASFREFRRWRCSEGDDREPTSQAKKLPRMLGILVHPDSAVIRLTIQEHDSACKSD